MYVCSVLPLRDSWWHSTSLSTFFPLPTACQFSMSFRQEEKRGFRIRNTVGTYNMKTDARQKHTEHTNTDRGRQDQKKSFDKEEKKGKGDDTEGISHSFPFLISDSQKLPELKQKFKLKTHSILWQYIKHRQTIQVVSEWWDSLIIGLSHSHSTCIFSLLPYFLLTLTKWIEEMASKQ